MKKTVSKKKKTPAKNSKNSRKKPKKSKVSDGLRAFLLVVLIVAFSALISLTIITIHTSMKNKNTEMSDNKEDHTQNNELTQTVTAPVNIVSENKNEIEKPQPVSPRPSAQETAPKSTNSEPEDRSFPRTSTPSRPETTATAVQKPVQNIGALVFVIDDAGNNLRELEPFLNLPGSLTIAVLPGLPYSAEAARRIRAAGKEVILHQPMEAIGAQDPGPGAIISGMNANEIREVFTRNIAEVGPVAGMNNHQGSKITMDAEAMKTILNFCIENKIYFLDSRTTAETVVPSVAQQIGMKIAERNVFIDNEQNKDAMLRYITTGLTRAQRNGSVIMIGHTWSPALAPLLAEMFPRYIEQGYTIKKVSDILK